MSLIDQLICLGPDAARLSVNGALFSASSLYTDPQSGPAPANMPMGIAGPLAPFTWTAEATYSFQTNCSYRLVGTVNNLTLFDSGYQNANVGGSLQTFLLSPVVPQPSSGFFAIASIQWTLWEQGAGPAQVVAQQSIYVELYLFPTPASTFNNVTQLPQGFPVELLREFLSFAQASPTGVGAGMGWESRLLDGALAFSFDRLTAVDPTEVAAAVALFVFTRRGAQYNRSTMNPSFCPIPDSGVFNLNGYVFAPPGYFVNCQDQNAILWLILTYVFGHNVTPYRVDRAPQVTGAVFFINAQLLVGWGLANNPNNEHTSMPLALMDTQDRSGFANHRLCVDQTAGGTTFDATIGPYLGMPSQPVYATLVLDPAMPGTLSTPNDYTTHYQGLQFV